MYGVIESPSATNWSDDFNMMWTFCVYTSKINGGPYICFIIKVWYNYMQKQLFFPTEAIL